MRSGRPRPVADLAPPDFDYTRYSDFSIVSDPWSLRSDGTTFWVSQDNTSPKNHAYHLKDAPDADADEYGTRASSKDFAYRGVSPDEDAGEIILCYGSVVYGDHIYLSDSTSLLSPFLLMDDPLTTKNENGAPDPERAIEMLISGVRGLHREGDLLWCTGPNHLSPVFKVR